MALHCARLSAFAFASLISASLAAQTPAILAGGWSYRATDFTPQPIGSHTKTGGRPGEAPFLGHGMDKEAKWISREVALHEGRTYRPLREQ